MQVQIKPALFSLQNEVANSTVCCLLFRDFCLSFWRNLIYCFLTLQGLSAFGYSDPYISGLYTAYGPQPYVSNLLWFLSLVCTPFVLK